MMPEPGLNGSDVLDCLEAQTRGGGRLPAFQASRMAFEDRSGHFPGCDPMSAVVRLGSRVTQSRLPLFPEQQTFLSPPVTSDKCQQRTHALQQIATMFDAFPCRWSNSRQHQSQTTRSRRIRRLDGAFECIDWRSSICSNVARWLARSRTPF